MTYWQGLILGVVQGLTEFLPISSSGHLVVAEAAIGLSTPGVVVEVALHVATVLAVVFVYGQRLWLLLRGALGGRREAWEYIGLLAVGTVPAAAIGVTFASVFERAFDSLLAVGVSFALTGMMLWSTRYLVTPPAAMHPSARGALGIGIAQALALFPGISRSGATVAAALWLRVRPARAAEFSFLLAIPAIAGAAVLQFPRLSTELGTVGRGPLAVSFLAALLAGVLAIRTLVVMLERGVFHRFAPYCWLVGLITIVWAVVR